MAEVLGINPLEEHWSRSADRSTGRAAESALEALVEQQLEQRQAARRERDFERADAIRDALVAAGVGIEDTPSGARWSLARTAGTDDEEN
jgi:cysteinyl-tRNA synthetase